MNPTRIQLRYDTLENWQKTNPSPKLAQGEMGIANNNGTIIAKVGTSENPQTWDQAHELSVFNGNQPNTQIIGGTGIQVTENTENVFTISLANDALDSFVDLIIESGDGINTTKTTNNTYQLSLSNDVLRNVNLSGSDLNKGDILVYDDNLWVNKNLSSQIKTEGGLFLKENSDGSITLSQQSQENLEYIDSSCGIHFRDESQEKWYNMGIGITGYPSLTYSCFYDSARNNVWVGGNFRAANGYLSNNIALWDVGTSNFTESYGVGGTENLQSSVRIWSIEKYNDEIYFAGTFDRLTDPSLTSEQSSVKNIAKVSYDVDGNLKWEKVGPIGRLGGNSVKKLISFSGKLYAYGSINPTDTATGPVEDVSGSIISWNGTSWNNFTDTPPGVILSTPNEDNRIDSMLGVIGNEMYFSVNYKIIENGQTTAIKSCIYKWDGNNVWTKVGNDFPGNYNAYVSGAPIVSFKSSLYIPLAPTGAGGVGATRIFKLNSSNNNWEEVNPGINGVFIRKLKATDDFLYVIGAFIKRNGSLEGEYSIMKYDGTTWLDLPPQPFYEGASGTMDFTFDDDENIYVAGMSCRGAENIAGPTGDIIEDSIDITGGCCNIYALSYVGNDPDNDLVLECIGDIKRINGTSSSPWFWETPGGINKCENGPTYNEFSDIEPKPRLNNVSFISNKSEGLRGWTSTSRLAEFIQESVTLVSHPYWPKTVLSCQDFENGVVSLSKPQRPFCPYQSSYLDENGGGGSIINGYSNLVWLTNVEIWTLDYSDGTLPTISQNGRLSGWFPTNILEVAGNCGTQCDSEDICVVCANGDVICKCIDDGQGGLECPVDPCGLNACPANPIGLVYSPRLFSTDIDYSEYGIVSIFVQQQDEYTDPVTFVMYFPSTSHRTVTILQDYNSPVTGGLIYWDSGVRDWKLSKTIDAGDYTSA